MDKITLRSPAKLNLYLEILGKRADGYHRIETVFERIDLSDRIVLKRRREGITLISNRPGLPVDERNLAYKAAKLLFEKAKSRHGTAIEIEKNIPISAGLGGGSSNAASVLLGLNKLYNFRLGKEGLLELARLIGADVAFFIEDRSFAKGTSRGDILTPIVTNFRLWHVLVMPPYEVSSKEMYESRRPSAAVPVLGPNRVIEALKNKHLTDLSRLLYNSLEDGVLARHSVIGRVKKDLINKGASAALVSGSGPVLFGITKTGKEAVNIAAKLKKGALAGKKEWQVRVVRTA